MVRPPQLLPSPLQRCPCFPGILRRRSLAASAAAPAAAAALRPGFVILSSRPLTAASQQPVWLVLWAKISSTHPPAAPPTLQGAIDFAVRIDCRDLGRRPRVEVLPGVTRALAVRPDGTGAAPASPPCPTCAASCAPAASAVVLAAPWSALPPAAAEPVKAWPTRGGAMWRCPLPSRPTTPKAGLPPGQPTPPKPTLCFFAALRPPSQDLSPPSQNTEQASVPTATPPTHPPPPQSSTPAPLALWWSCCASSSAATGPTPGRRRAARTAALRGRPQSSLKGRATQRCRQGEGGRGGEGSVRKEEGGGGEAERRASPGIRCCCGARLAWQCAQPSSPLPPFHPRRPSAARRVTGWSEASGPAPAAATCGAPRCMHAPKSALLRLMGQPACRGATPQASAADSCLALACALQSAAGAAATYSTTPRGPSPACAAHPSHVTSAHMPPGCGPATTRLTLK
jgi:hypothetical protein